jgi:hypothetical protein
LPLWWAASAAACGASVTRRPLDRALARDRSINICRKGPVTRWKYGVARCAVLGIVRSDGQLSPVEWADPRYRD